MNAPAILHLDMDAFYASVEQIDHPELAGRPVVVGGLGSRGVVAAASYEARAFGIHSAMPSVRARRACPEAVFVAPRLDRYTEVSRDVMTILRSATPLVEPLSLDEAFLDVTGAQRLLGSGPEIGEMLRTRLRDELGLAASVGVAVTKMLAKIASDIAKPDGMLVIQPGTELEFLHPLPVTRLWGVGPATRRRVERYGVRTIGELSALPVETLVQALGPAAGRHLHDLAWNRDPRPVESQRRAKSIGHEETFAVDRTSRRRLEQDVVRMADLVGARLRDHHVTARTVQLKLRYPDFATITRSRTLADPTDLALVIGRAALALLAEVDVSAGIRLLGVSAMQIDDVAAVQGQLALAETISPQQAALERTLDAVRERFGAQAVGRAAHSSGPSVQTDRRGSLWGPDHETKD